MNNDNMEIEKTNQNFYQQQPKRERNITYCHILQTSSQGHSAVKLWRRAQPVTAPPPCSSRANPGVGMMGKLVNLGRTFSSSKEAGVRRDVRRNQDKKESKEWG